MFKKIYIVIFILVCRTFSSELKYLDNADYPEATDHVLHKAEGCGICKKVAGTPDICWPNNYGRGVHQDCYDLVKQFEQDTLEKHLQDNRIGWNWKVHKEYSNLLHLLIDSQYPSIRRFIKSNNQSEVFRIFNIASIGAIQKFQNEKNNHEN